MREISGDSAFTEHFLLEEEAHLKLKSAYEPSGPDQAGAYPCFCGMKRPGVFLLSAGWDASSSQGYL